VIVVVAMTMVPTVVVPLTLMAALTVVLVEALQMVVLLLVGVVGRKREGTKGGHLARPCMDYVVARGTRRRV
jgi:hypothetical protein